MSDCYCDYGDPAIFYRAEHRTARKVYECAECNGPISPTEKYEYVSAKWYEGYGIDQIRTCERCYDIRIWLQNNVPCFCFAHHGLHETAEEAIKEARERAPAETVGLKFGYLRRIVLRDRFNRAARQAVAA